MSNDRKQNFKNLYTTNTNATNEIACIVAGMNSQREADGHQHHILKLSSHPYFNRIPVEGGRSWSKATDSDGRKTCCNVFYNSAELKEKCSNVAFQWCVECSVINFNTYYLCDECTRHGESPDFELNKSLHERYPPATNFYAERRYLKEGNIDSDEDG